MLSELIATEGVEEVHRRGGPLGVMAIHAGLEEGTYHIADVVSRMTGSALYAVVQPQELWWHVPSIRYDPADSAVLAGFLDSIHAAISLHGYGEPGLEDTALLGGRNRDFALAIERELGSRGIKAVARLEDIPRRLRGTHRRNPVNLPAQSGVQVELPMSLREGANSAGVVAALAAAVEGYVAGLPASDRAG